MLYSWKLIIGFYQFNLESHDKQLELRFAWQQEMF